ncbi:MAG TPA: hypothetical protein PLQ76_07650 [bacterium]|nr:hypothetical protein [bacterium]
MTERNRTLLAAKVEEMRRTELVTFTKGRLKSKPIPFSFHTAYQSLLQDNDLFIRMQTEYYANAISEMSRVFGDFEQETRSEQGTDLKRLFDGELIRTYDLSDEIKAADSIMKLSEALESSMYGMQALPVRARLAFNTLRWMQKGGLVTPASFEELKVLAGKWNLAVDVFSMSRQLTELSKSCSLMMLKITEGSR